jgi:hypothetical protein
MAGGICFCVPTFAAKGLCAIAAIMLMHTSTTITTTLRDTEEGRRMINKIEDAKTEKLLMDIQKHSTM